MMIKIRDNCPCLACFQLLLKGWIGAAMCAPITQLLRKGTTHVPLQNDGTGARRDRCPDHHDHEYPGLVRDRCRSRRGVAGYRRCGRRAANVHRSARRWRCGSRGSERAPRASGSCCDAWGDHRVRAGLPPRVRGLRAQGTQVRPQGHQGRARCCGRVRGGHARADHVSGIPVGR